MLGSSYNTEERNDGDLEYSGSSRGNVMWSDSGCALETEPTKCRV